jgi:hypothetical protein
MLEEQMIDMEAGYGEMWSVSSRCVNCGHRHDAVIQHHRHAYARPVAVSQTVAVSEVVDLSWDAEQEPLAA